jgi:hypothetical protein
MKDESKGKQKKREAYKAEVGELPAFLRGGRSRVKEVVAMSAVVSREMKDYLRWATMAAGMPAEELQVHFLDRVLGDYFRSDTAWQDAKRAMRAGSEDGEEEGTAKSSDGGAPKPSSDDASSGGGSRRKNDAESRSGGLPSPPAPPSLNGANGASSAAERSR